jgi:SAM-dependent methyltransferase
MRRRQLRARNAKRPASEVFSEVYERGQWGGAAFHSGTGSRGGAAAVYSSYIAQLIRASRAHTVVDVGCGDFHVAAGFADVASLYIGVDIVPAVVHRNRERHGRPGVEFALLDAAREDLPSGDLCLLRQVLQHLSNAQVAAILERCRRYPLVVITEHWPDPRFAGRANVDKPHGPDTRLDSGSWVDLTQPPFGLSRIEDGPVVPAEACLFGPGETIRTHLWRPSSWPD